MSYFLAAVVLMSAMNASAGDRKEAPIAVIENGGALLKIINDAAQAYGLPGNCRLSYLLFQLREQNQTRCDRLFLDVRDERGLRRLAFYGHDKCRDLTLDDYAFTRKDSGARGENMALEYRVVTGTDEGNEVMATRTQVALHGLPGSSRKIVSIKSELYAVVNGKWELRDSLTCK